jgi:hypothetical protein
MSRGRKSPLTVEYDDIIHDLERRRAQAELYYPGLVTTGKMSNWTARHRISVLDVTIRIFKKHKKNPQLNLNDIFEDTPPRMVQPMPPGPDVQPMDDPDLYFTPEM